ncbi:MAG TPA: MFS transporter [Streptosporangiaceae bacterium]|jgi:GPH family glycoside/pentoside/hexuronide:cation symporter
MASTPLSRSVRIGYGLGSFCSGTFSTVPGLLLLYYLTNVLAVPAGVAGIVIFLPKAWDLVINTYVGRWSDRTVSRFGPRRPWLLAGAVALPPTFILTFAGPPLRGGGAALYVCLCFFAAATAFALFEVPYKAMPAEMTDDYHEQSGLLTWRIAFLGLAILLSGGVATQIANSQGDTGTVGGYRLMGIVTGAVLFVAMVATFVGTAKAPYIARVQAGSASLWRQLMAARSNRSFLKLLGLSCAQMLAAGSMLAGAPYFATYILKDVDAVGTLFLALVGPMMLTMPLWVRIARRYDKRGAMVLASVLFMIGGFSLTFTQAFGSVYAHVCVVVIGVGYAGLQLLQFSMLADTLIADQLESGISRSGVFTGLWTAAETVIFAFGALLLGWILSASGFVSSQPDEPVAQPDSAITAVLIGGAAVPALLVSIAIVLTLRYDVTAERLAELRARHGDDRAQRLEPTADSG